jgi:Virulence factor BrkB
MKNSGLAKWGEGVPGKFRLFLDALKRFNKDHCFLLSSGIAFALLLCLIPLLLLVLVLIGTYLFSDQEVLNHISEYLKDMFPSQDPRIRESILKIVQDRQIVGILGIGGLLWTSTWVFSSLGNALNIIFRVGKGRSSPGEGRRSLHALSGGNNPVGKYGPQLGDYPLPGLPIQGPSGYRLSFSSHPEIPHTIPLYVLHVFLDLQDRPQ